MEMLAAANLRFYDNGLMEDVIQDIKQKSKSLIQFAENLMKLQINLKIKIKKRVIYSVYLVKGDERMNSDKSKQMFKEKERLRELKERMRAETQDMVLDAKSHVKREERLIEEMLHEINQAGQGIEEAFEGEASEAAIKSIDKIKQNNKTLDTNFHCF